MDLKLRLKNYTTANILPTIVAGAGTCLLKGIHLTCRHYTINDAIEKELLNGNKPILYTTWHFAFPAMSYFFSRYFRIYPGIRGVIMVSASQDGELVARVLERLGFAIIRGSSHRRGVEALSKMIKYVKQGYHAGLMADGSQGPPRKAQKGILLLSKYTGSPIMPVIFSAKPRLTFPSWDKTQLCLPFGKLVTAFGKPILVHRETPKNELETFRILLENQLNELCHITGDFSH